MMRHPDLISDLELRDLDPSPLGRVNSLFPATKASAGRPCVVRMSRRGLDGASRSGSEFEDRLDAHVQEAVDPVRFDGLSYFIQGENQISRVYVLDGDKPLAFTASPQDR